MHIATAPDWPGNPSPTGRVCLFNLSGTHPFATKGAFGAEGRFGIRELAGIAAPGMTGAARLNQRRRINRRSGSANCLSLLPEMESM